MNHWRCGSPAEARAQQSQKHAPTSHVTKCRSALGLTAVSEIVVEEGLAVAHVAVHELSALLRDLRELRTVPR